tara:strand:- start:176 stop:457 length:282 start_codon:yes stop_codon:yes gene_type:complete
MGAIQRKYDDLFWLRLYMQVRLKEMQIGLSKQAIEQEMGEIKQHYVLHGYESALEEVAYRLAFHLEEQTSKFLYFKAQRGNILTSGKTPDIIL